jgi:hypothetical protein
MFTARGSGSWPFRSDEGIAAMRFTVRDGTGYVWAIERDPERTGCGSQTSPPFPVAYGSAVPCFRTLVEPRRIRGNTLYHVVGSGSRHGSGYFRYEPFAGGGRATNLDWNDVESEVRSWPVVPEPRRRDQNRSSTSAAPAAADSNAVSANKP